MITQLLTDGTILVDTTVALAAAITSTATSIQITTSGADVSNGNYLTIQAEGANTTETVLVVSGGGTSNLTVTRAQTGTVASAHAKGAAVILQNGITVQLLAISTVPNLDLIVRKTSPDANVVNVTAGIDPVTSIQNVFPDGSTVVTLTDNQSNGVTRIKFPRGSNVLIVLGGVGAQTGSGTGIVTFMPSRPNYGEIALANIAVQGASGDISQLHAYVAYVEELQVSRYATLGGVIAFDPTAPSASYTATITASTNPRGLTQWGDFQVGDFCILNDTEIDYFSPSIGNGAYAPLTAAIGSGDTTIQVGVPASSSTDAMPSMGGFTVLIDSEFILIATVVKITDGKGNLTGYTWSGCTRGALGATAAAHSAGVFAYHLTSTHFAKYEIFLITAKSGSQWTVQRHWTGDSPRRAIFESWLSQHSTGKKIFKLEVKHFDDQIKSSNLGTNPPTANTPSSTGGSSVVIPDFVMQLPHACVCAISVAATDSDGTGPFTVYNCAQFDNNRNPNLPVLPGIRTLDGASYVLPQFTGPLFDGMFLTPPWQLQHWSTIRCAYCYVTTAPQFEPAEIHLQISYPGDVNAMTGNLIWSLAAKMRINVGQTQSWQWNDPNPGASGNYPPPTQYNNPYYESIADETLDEHNWPVWSHNETSFGTGTDSQRSFEGDALIRWVVVKNGGKTITTTLTAGIDNQTNTIPIASGTGISNGDFIQIDNEILLVKYGGGTTSLTALRGVMPYLNPDGTTVAAAAASHTNGTNVVDIVAQGAVDLTVVVQT